MKSKNLNNFVQILESLDEFFEGNDVKVFAWLNTKNPHLGYDTPMNIIEIGRSEKLLEFVNIQLG